MLFCEGAGVVGKDIHYSVMVMASTGDPEKDLDLALNVGPLKLACFSVPDHNGSPDEQAAQARLFEERLVTALSAAVKEITHD